MELKDIMMIFVENINPPVDEEMKMAIKDENEDEDSFGTDEDMIEEISP
jgi:hypothetical protein